MLLKDRVIDYIEKSMKRLGDLKDLPPVKVEYARDEKFGDYACTIAMDKRWREAYKSIDPSFSNPLTFAQKISSLLKNEADEFFESVEAVKPGFINIKLSSKILYEFASKALVEKENYGKSKTKNPKKIIFEYVSANPTGPLNVVSARAAALGDSCCNLLEAAGENVFREYYVNDFGNQVNLLGWSCMLRLMETLGIKLKFSKKDKEGNVSYGEEAGLPFPSEGYHGEYLTDIVKKICEVNHLEIQKDLLEKAKIISKRKDVSQEEVFSIPDALQFSEKLGILATSHFLETHKRDLKGFRVEFSGFFSERSLHEKGRVLEMKDKLKDFVYEEDNKILFRSTDFGDDKDRVIVRDDGRPTYLLADIAYHFEKISRGYHDIYNIWGPDHHGYISRLSGAMQALGFPVEHFKVLIAQQVNLLENGKPIVMSKRTGKFITMETLVEEIPVDVIRYYFVMRSFESHLDFDFAEAKDTSEKNPYYYVAYAHARIRSIFRKAAEKGLLKSDPENRTETSRLISQAEMPEMSEERKKLLWLAARFPEEVRDSAFNLEPHRMITYLYQLAGALSRFYSTPQNRIVDQDETTALGLLSILDAVSWSLKNGLKLLGMEAPESMMREELPEEYSK